MKKIVISLLVIFICISCDKVIIDKLPKDTFVNLTEAKFEVYSDVTLKDLIKETNLPYNDNVKIKTNKLGKNTYNWEFTYDKKKYLYHLTYQVVDTTKPKIFGGANKTFLTGNEQDICNLVMYGDNYDKEPICTTDGEYDFNTPGSYKVKIIVTDSSKNMNNFNMTLNIIEPVKNDDNSNNSNTETKQEKVDFTNIYNNYKKDNTKIGIDVSRWQGDIDYNAVKNAGAEFVMMRIGVQQDILEDPSIDSKFFQNIKNAHEAGLDVGVYFYSMAMDNKEAKRQAEWVIKTLKKEKLELPIVFDWENWTDWNSYQLSFYDINSLADTFMNTVKNKGYEAMIYSSKFYLQNIWDNKDNYSVWLAHYTKNSKLTDYEGSYKLWQICNNGKIAGIETDVDIDIMFLN